MRDVPVHFNVGVRRNQVGAGDPIGKLRRDAARDVGIGVEATPQQVRQSAGIS